MRLSPAFWAVLIALIASFATASQVITIPPIEGKTGDAKLMLFVPGGKVPNEHYRPTAVAIQEASSLKLWVVIPACLLDLCAPTSEIGMALQSGQQISGLTDKDTFVGGHSLGGTVAHQFIDIYYAVGRNFQASFLFGTNYPAQLDNPKLPQLEVGGEIDQVSIANMSPAYSRFTKGAKKDLAAAARSLDASPVFILEDLNHSDFCPGFFVPGDCKSATTPEKATAAIGSITGAWLDLISNPKDKAALQVLSDGLSATEKLMRPSVDLHALESGEWCKTAQKHLSGLAPKQADLLEIQVASSGQASGKLLPSGKLQLTVVSNAYYPPGIAPTTYDTVAGDITCNFLGAAKVQELLGVSGATNSTSCEEVDALAISMAAEVSLDQVKARYSSAPQLSAGKDVAWGGDNAHLTETFAANGDKTVSSPALVNADGTHECKLLSPEKALAWMMTDSLRTKK